MIRTLALVLALLLPLAAHAQEEGQPNGEIAVEADATSDAAIERRIEGIVAELDGFDAVEVEVREGIVTFSGEVIDADAARLDDLAARVQGVVAVENEIAASTDIADRIDPLADRFRARIEQAVAFTPLLLVALFAGLAVATLGWMLAGWRRPWDRLAPNAFIAEIYRMVLRLVAVLLGVVVALDILNLTGILAGVFGAAGIVGLAVGFAVRDTVENFIASVLLSLRQPFRPDDLVEIEGDLGTVVRLTSRATILLDPDGNHLRIPNATVFKAKILNFTRNPQRRFGFVLGIDPGDDPAEAKRIGLEVLRGLDFVLDQPPPQAWIDNIGASTIDMQYFAWVDQTAALWPVARSEAIRLVMDALTRADIGLPEPTYRLNLLGGGLPVVDLPDAENRPDEVVLSESEPAALPAAEAEDVTPEPEMEGLAQAERERSPNLLTAAAPEE
ncbi:mechanosensitive ion channel [Jannaschia sp. Os4]|uniref:mechanosensitive ion channel family protein n=1 Tax=Jannaschia sp. Os4 TaxID=2807617 RepID=UPI00193A07EA|nr:mechanosensitive ion channel family protein [Jannaschia sp. Os4]MBM2576781.1 mechanosensitive ion channel [Jannaschia sp. Os4]